MILGCSGRFLLHSSLALAALGFAGNSRTCRAQTAQEPSVRVETHEVAFPVLVLEERKDPKGLILGPNGEETPAWIYSVQEVNGLSERSFRIFEDGVEQKIQHFSVEALNQWFVEDNVGQHVELSWTPGGIWGASDSKGKIQPTDTGHAYFITYIPPPSPGGSCHQIALKVDKKHSSVYAPDQYCNTKDPLADPVDGTAVGNRLLEYANSSQSGSTLLEARPSIPLAMQLTAFSGLSGATRINVSAGFPPDLLHRQWRENKLFLSVALLGLVYDKSHALVTRFSDIACPTTECVQGLKGAVPASASSPMFVADHKWAESWLVPASYRTQLELEAGDYQLELLITDGEKFGRTEGSLSVEDFSKQEFAISGIALCKRYHAPLPDEKAPTRAPQYVRLMFDGKEFTPAGRTHFKGNEEMMVYLEIYGSHVEADPQQRLSLEMKISNTVNNQLVVGTGLRPVASSTSAAPTKYAIPVVWQMAVDKLPSGTYRLEAQASDSSGRKTEWRSTFFTIE